MNNAALAGVRDYDLTRASRYPDARAALEQADWLRWEELGGLRPSTLDQYSRATDVALKLFPSVAFREFTDSHLGAVATSFPPAGRQSRMAAYSKWFDWGFRMRKIEENPMLRLPSMRHRRKKYVDTYTDAEVERLCSLPLPDGPLLRILFESGLRKGEACHLRPMDYKPDSRSLVVLDGKGGKDRVIPAFKLLREAIAELVMFEAIEPKQYFWCGYRNTGRCKPPVPLRDRPCLPSTFHIWWTRCVSDAGVRYLKPHTTRHTFSTRLRRRGVSIDDLSVILGHESVDTTYNTYVHVEPDEVAARLAALVEDGMA